MSDHHPPVTVDDGDPVLEILETFRAPTEPAAMSRARRLARAAHTAALNVRGVALTAVTVDGSESGGYVVELRVVSRRAAPPDVVRAIAQRVREAADDRGLGPYVEDVAIVVDGLRS